MSFIEEYKNLSPQEKLNFNGKIIILSWALMTLFLIIENWFLFTIFFVIFLVDLHIIVREIKKGKTK